MFLLDTNVISELRWPEKASRPVVEWAGPVAQDDIFPSAIAVYKLEVGVQQKERADAAQGSVLRAWLTGQVMSEFAERVIELDGSAAAMAAMLVVKHRGLRSRRVHRRNSHTRQLTVVTRNVEHFAPTNVAMINPWEYKSV